MNSMDYNTITRVFNVQITRLHEHKNAGDTRLDESIIELHILADKLANELKKTNRDFNTDKFLNDCGVLNNPFDAESSNYIA